MSEERVFNCKVWKKRDDGSMASQIVKSNAIPKGWTPDPAEAEKLYEAPKRRGRPKKVK